MSGPSTVGPMVCAPQPLHAHAPPPDAFDAWVHAEPEDGKHALDFGDGYLEAQAPFDVYGMDIDMSAVEVSAAGYGYYAQEPVF